MRGRPAAIGIIITALAGACLFHHDPTDPTDAATTTGTSTGSTTEAVPTAGEDQCPNNCPYPGPCKQITCVEGACGVADLPEGTAWPGTPGDCRQDVCDGQGGLDSVLADDPPNQVPGDCQRFVCDQGDAVVMLDASDVPDDDNDCTDDTCEDGTPTNTPKAMHTACGPGDAHFCHTDAACRPCKQVTDACEDYGQEPHDNQETAQNLGTITDADDDGSFVCGTIRGANDIDWYTFAGDDAFLNYVDPVRSLFQQNGSGGQVCVYIQCSSGSTSINCNGATPSTAPLGQKGCCSPTSVAPKLNCGGLDDSAKLWIRVDTPDNLACVPYQLDYHF
ncbi:hypothetical protein [Nannocystis punicea]|uniref:Metal-binding motif-containing protein n=1 Tax=Nannocystis punicea TaxID=2995304 RepID=A0ABY7HG67_9BACT|nr:hypothetical protein [Nannocystis poenicansa]WAS98072.1 hypothetical protein O0S08_18185 [Nannocystis poenicansa]